MRDLATTHPEPVRRWWFFWTTNYAAGIVLASLIIRCTTCHLASAALPVLDGVVKLFEEVKPMFTPANMMDVLKRLQEAAHEAVKGQGGFPNTSRNDLELELPMLDGRTCLISRKTPTSSHANTPSASQSPQPMPSRQESRAAFGDVHPAVLEYFNLLDGGSPPSLSIYAEGDVRYGPQAQTPSSSSATSPPVHHPFAEGSAYWTSQWSQPYSNGAGGVQHQATSVPGASGPAHVDPMMVPQSGYNRVGENYPGLLPLTGGGNGNNINEAGEAVAMDLTSFPGEASWNGLLDELGLPQSGDTLTAMPNSGWGQFGM